MEGKMRFIQQKILVFLIIREDRTTITKTERKKPRQLPHIFTANFHCDSIYEELMKIIPNLVVWLEEDYSKTSVLRQTSRIINDMMDP